MAETITHDRTTYNEDQLLQLVSEVKDYQLTHGSLLKTVEYEIDSSVPARPVAASILPTSLSRKHFEEAIQLQYPFNELYVHAGSNAEWLYSVLQPLMQHDAFVAALWEIYAKVRDAGVLQDVVCGVFRSDYYAPSSIGSF